MKWQEISVTVSSEGEEAVAALFYEYGAKGVAVDDPGLIREYMISGIWDAHGFADMEPTGCCLIKGYFPEDERILDILSGIREGLARLKVLFPEWILRSETGTVRERDWADEWKKFFKPVRIGRRWLIEPTWEKAEVQENDILIRIDPGMAFGTGTHPTTSLCLEAIEDLVKPGMTVFDIGTGSGILAVAAAKLGGKVQAGDIDALAVRIAKENAELNQVEGKVTVEAGNLGDIFKGRADVVIANIVADVIIELLPQLENLMAEDGVFVASGIIDTRVQDLETEIQKAGMRMIRKREDAGWAAIEAVREGYYA
ncbi:(LSU ribosomal protein L11P)-lysine N-methyltransferase [Syntrophobotulus glycolicus DSM 8271]|uniref:Ribosomal protein L11 methyltransferase n=1 Tax=Syntrophobotulus glycolicus (strain DSM 8271 / FlGlyR) TaxID=645991 RepID=F0SVE7_SYNGF|nr:50S ribosomal protein L11 methyltransferase [Syntrophobotulus glycolicus]ADY56720.1 (LSU ribosomal protein L11P)-lysine N-methyltransferase [Syntrophobotulus glycolicus DSM 8271]